MAMGKGRYDNHCTVVRDLTNADGVVVIVLGGNRGSGFSAQLSPELQAKLSDILEDLAKQIRDSAT